MKIYTVVRTLSKDKVLPMKSFISMKEAEAWAHLQIRLINMICKYYICEWEFSTPIGDKNIVTAISDKVRLIT